MVLSGWLSAFILNSMPTQSTWHIIGPTLLLGVGMGILRKNWLWKKAALTVVFSALAALTLMNNFFPDRQVTITAVKERFRKVYSGKMVAVNVSDTVSTELFIEPRFLETFAPINVRLFAQLPGPVQMLTTDQLGNIYATIPSLGAIYRLSDNDKDGFADASILYHVGLERPYGLLWDKNKLYVATPTQLLELQDSDNDNQVDKVRVVIDDLPDDGGHWQRAIAKGKDDFIYLSIGSRCNACQEDDDQLATILKINPATGESSTYASGLRNSTGLTFTADGRTLFGTENGRTGLGPNFPPDEINKIVSGGNYGWPYCYGNNITDITIGSADNCSNTIASSVDLPAHSSPRGTTFGDSLKAPEMYKNSLYTVMQGASTEDVITKAKLIRIPYQNKQLSSHGKEFLRGWDIAGKVWGKPVDVIVGSDGNLYISDELAQAIYQISWQQAN